MGNQTSRIPLDQTVKQFSHFKSSDISKWKKLFLKTFPSGYIKPKCLESFFYKIFPFSLPKNIKLINPNYFNIKSFKEEEILEYSYMLFKNINISGSGKIDFSELYIAFSILTEGSSFEKIRWLYRLFDLDQDGFISKEELLYSLEAYNDMVMENFSDYDINNINKIKENSTKKFVNNIFENNVYGILSFDEFKAVIEKTDIMPYFNLSRNDLMSNEEFYIY